MTDRNISITLCGDIALSRGVEAHYMANNTLPIDSEILQYLKNTDVLIGNLECPLTDNTQPKWHHFKTLKASIKCGEIIKKIGLDAVSLANNHIADYGEQGLKDTIDFLQRNDILWGGAGFSTEEAEKPITLIKNGYRIGILNLAQPEISAITSLGWGAAVLEAGSAIRQMQKLSSEVDIAIGFLHLGVEFFNYPTPDQVDLCRSLIKAGAKIIVCHHPHVPQGYETHRDGFITYGLGNFLFDMKPVNNTGSRIGVILRLSFEELEIRNVELVPIETANGFTSMLSRPLNQASEAFLTQLSKPLNDPAEISKHHYFTCRDNMMIHLKAFLFYGLLKKNLLKMKDLVRQQQWPQILEMRKSLFKYLVSGVAFKNESEKKVYPKSIESVVWRGICLFSGLLGRFFHVNTSSQQNLRR